MMVSEVEFGLFASSKTKREVVVKHQGTKCVAAKYPCKIMGPSDNQ
jgi:hypothetical protein